MRASSFWAENILWPLKSCTARTAKNLENSHQWKIASIPWNHLPKTGFKLSCLITIIFIPNCSKTHGKLAWAREIIENLTFWILASLFAYFRSYGLVQTLYNISCILNKKGVRVANFPVQVSLFKKYFGPKILFWFSRKFRTNLVLSISKKAVHSMPIHIKHGFGRGYSGYAAS